MAARGDDSTAIGAADGIRVVPLDGDARRAVEAACASPAALAQHHPVWLDVLTAAGEATAGAAAYRGDRLVGWMLAARRTGSAGTVVGSLPFVAYGGPVTIEGDPEARAALLRWFFDGAGGAAAGALGIGLSPFASADDVAAATAATGDARAYRYDNFAQIQPLAPHPLEQVSKRRRDALSRFIRRAEREGVRVGPCDDPAVFAEWMDIYRARYGEIGARPIADAFHQAAFDLGRAAGVVEFWTAHHGDRLLGGTLFLLGAEVVDYFSSAYHMDDEARALTPNNLLLSTAFGSLAERGKRWFNWQSSPGREGVYRYKEGWGAEERPQIYLGCLGPSGESVLAATPETLLAEYPARFVVPFSWLEPALAGPAEGGGD